MHFCIDCLISMQAVIPVLTVPAYYCVNYVSSLYYKIKK